MATTKTRQVFIALGDAWHNFRCAIAECVMVSALAIMPDGAEKARMESALYEYYLWLKDNGAC